MDKFRLKWQIFAFFLGFCAFLLTVLWLFQTVLLPDMYKLVRRTEIAEAVSHVRENIDSPELLAILKELEEEKEIMVIPAGDFDPADSRSSDRPGRMRQETLTRTETFTLANGGSISLTFHAMITPVEATVRTLRIQLYFITGFLLLLAVVLSFLIARRISRPIEEINRGAGHLAHGRYDIRFSGHGFREITELSETLNLAARDLGQVDRLRRELMANVSHDLRTPLSLIYSYAEMMHDFPDEITPAQTEVIMEETRRLSLLVTDMLDLSQLEGRLEKVNLTEFSVTDVLGRTVERATALWQGKGYELSFTYDVPQTVVTDEVKVVEAFYNLLTNAVNYGGPAKKVQVRQVSSPGRVRIEVRDFGEGIDPETLPYIWDRYYKAGKAHQRAVAGSGLGLSIVRHIFELLDIPYGVFSESGQGSTFWFELKTKEPGPLPEGN